MTSPGHVSARTLVMALLAPMAACVSGYSNHPTDPGACSANIVPALALEVRDAATHAAAASGVLATGLVSGTHGTYTLTPINSDSLTIWFGSTSGTYSVALQKAGYQDVTKTGIVVPPADSLDCHPATVTLSIDLQPKS